MKHMFSQSTTMASKVVLLLLFATLFPLSFASRSRQNQPRFNKPNALILPVLKDNQTRLHVAQIYKRTPLQSIPLLVDLNGRFLAIHCADNYSSSTYNAPFCHSTQCARAGPHYCHRCTTSTNRPGCHNNTCAVLATNPFTNQNVEAEISEDVLGVPSFQDSNPGPLAIVRRFLFACASSRLLQGPFPRNVQGVAGLGHSPISLPIQLSSHFGFPSKFALCLSSQNNTNGSIFFGNTTYRTRAGKDFSQGLRYTPLSIGPRGEYFVLVKSIRINQRDVPLNRSLISRTRSFGGAMISTTTPYTILEHSIFRTFTESFTREISALGATQVNAIPPFGACFKNLRQDPRTGVRGPTIQFVMQNRNINWTFSGPNTLVQAGDGVWCLPFVQAGRNARSSIVIGAHQLEDTIVEFDLGTSRLGFSDSLRLSNASCAQFNFTSRPQTLEDFDPSFETVSQLDELPDEIINNP